MVKMYSQPTDSALMVSLFNVNLKFVICIDLICFFTISETRVSVKILSDHEVLSQNAMGFFYFEERILFVIW